MPLISILANGMRDSSGSPLATGTVDFYLSGTTTRETVYSDMELETPHANPATLDDGGRLKAYSSASLRLVFTSSAGTAIGTYDDATGGVTYADDVLLVTPGAADTYTSPHVDGALTAVNTSLSNAGSVDAKYMTTRTGGVARNVYLKLQEVMDVRDFGATGDGSTDDTAAFTAAFTACATTGGAVYVPTGTYKVTSAITISKNNCTLFGDGNSSILACTGLFTLVDITSTAANVTVRDMQLQGDGTSADATSIGVAMAAGTSNIHIQDLTFGGRQGSTGFNVGVSCSGTSGDYYVDRCHFTKVYGVTTTGVSGTGVLGTACLRLRVADCHFIGASTMNDAIKTTGGATYCEFVDNFINGTVCTGVNVATGSSYMTVRDNIINSITNGGLAVIGGNGIYMVAATTSTVQGNFCIACARNGIMLDTSSSRAVVKGNHCRGNTVNGILIDDLSTSNAVSENQCYANTNHGLAWITASASTSPHNGGAVSRNLAESNGKSGFFFQGTSFLSIAANDARNNSTASSGTLPAYDVSTYLSGGTYYGAASNNFTANTCSDTAGSRHLCAIRFVDEDGGVTSDATATTFSSNRLNGNIFPPQNGAAAVLMVGAVINSTTTSPDGLPVLTTTAAITMSGLASGTHIFVDTTGGSRTITLPSPAIVGAGTRFKITKKVSVNIVTVTGGATNIRAYAAALVTNLLGTSLGGCIELVSDGTVYYLIDLRTAATADWTTS